MFTQFTVARLNHLLLAKPQQLAAFSQQVNGLRDEVEQLGQRIQQLSKAK